MISHQKTTYTEKLLLLIFFLYPAIVWFIFSQRYEIVSTLFYLQAIAVVTLFVCSIGIMDSTMLLYTMAIIAISFFSVMISSINEGVVLSFRGLVNYFGFCVCLMVILFFSSSTIALSNITIIRIVKIGFFTAALFPIAYGVFGFSVNANLFTMNFTNPNLTGIFLLQSIFFCFAFFSLFRGFFPRIAAVVVGAIDTFFMMATDARNSAITLFFVILAVMYLLLREKKKVPALFIAGVACFPLLFLIVYLTMINFILNSSYFNFLYAEGKPLDGRVGIWNYILNELSGNMLFGRFFVVGGNAHNSLLSVLSGFGIIVLALTIIFLYKAMRRCTYSITSKFQIVCFCMFCGTMIMGMAEGSLFVGSVGIYVPACSFLLLARQGVESDRYDKKGL